MTTQVQFLHERQRTYHRFVTWGAVFGAHVVVILGLLALFRT